MTADSREERVAKYDRVASQGYASRYADPSVVARAQIHLLSSWGRRIPPGSTVLEIGCADGLVTEALARAGYLVTAIDVSPNMIARASERLDRARLSAQFRVADVEELSLSERYDGVLGLMWTFFAYVEEPDSLLRGLVRHAAGKILLDVDPRTYGVPAALASVAKAGFENVSWRSFLVPQRFRLPAAVRLALRPAERLPGVRSIPLPWKFVAVVKGER